jgi:hypothetical protein
MENFTGKTIFLFTVLFVIGDNICKVHGRDKRFFLRLQEERFEKIKKFFKNLKVPIIDVNMGADIKDPILPAENVEIVQFGEDFVIVAASKLLGFKHCFYKAIEYFYSKYSKFFIKVKDMYKDDKIIIVKFVAYERES